MTVPVDPLGAHVRRGTLFGQSDQLAHRLLEFRREHVVGVIAKAVVAQRNVRRVLESLLAISAKRFHPDVANSRRRECLCKGIAIELRQTTRPGKGPDVYESLDGMPSKCVDQFVQRASGMSDGVEGSQESLDAGR